MGGRRLLYLADGSSSGAVASSIRSAGWQVHEARDVAAARDLLVRMPFGVGLARLDAFGPEAEPLCRADDHISWVALLDRGARGDPGLCRMVADYCFDYHTLPVDLGRLLGTLGHAEGMAVLRRDGARTLPVAAAVKERGAEQPEMVAVCARMHEVFRCIRKMAAVEAPILLAGESGTGKELAARAIHERSGRAAGPFVAVNCGALPASLIQSELFGYEKGAFTGAQQRRAGRVEAAHHGTLFLDEIGDLPLALQVNLLRFLQEGAIQRVGGTREIPVDVRVMAATHIDLEAAVADGRFREDLYFRLNVLRLQMPPLRERGEDIELLARFFLAKFSDERQGAARGFSRAALHAISQHAWPGNVRELINRVRRAAVMSDGRMIGPQDLGFDVDLRRRRVTTLEEARSTAERHAVEVAVAAAARNLSEAARQLGVSRPALYRLIHKYDLAP